MRGFQRDPRHDTAVHMSIPVRALEFLSGGIVKAAWSRTEKCKDSSLNQRKRRDVCMEDREQVEDRKTENDKDIQPQISNKWRKEEKNYH